MLRLENDTFSKPFTYSIWLLMAFQAGYINVGAFYTSGNFVSHVTGTSSNIGMGLSKLDYSVLATFLVILGSFILGSAFAGHFIGYLKEIGSKPRYVLVTSVKAIFFGLVLLLSEFDTLSFATAHIDTINKFIIFMLSFCCGVQNSTCSISTKGFLKPTHMTGLSTDLGTNLTQIKAWKKSNPEKYLVEREKNRMRMGILASFISGGVISSMIFSLNGHYGFIFPFISSICFLITSYIWENETNEHSYVLRFAKSSILVTFFITLFIGIMSGASIAAGQ